MNRTIGVHAALLSVLLVTGFTFALYPPPARTSYTTPSGTSYALSPGVHGVGGCGPVSGGYECTMNGAVVVSVLDASGCGAKIGPASCTVIDGTPTYPPGTSTLECENKNYKISDGGTGKCTPNDGISMNCMLAGTNNFASAICESGCGPVGGSGSCTIQAKPK